MFSIGKTLKLPTAADALPGRSQPMTIGGRHQVLGTDMHPPFPEGMQQILFGMGCFWGAERRYWEQEGVHTTAVGYAGGFTPNPTYEEVCSGLTGHAEVVLVVFDPARLPLENCLDLFWTGHNPTSGMRQGPDIGTQYRSVIFTSNNDQLQLSQQSMADIARQRSALGSGSITTEIRPAPPFYYAEDYHQQYLARRSR